MPEHVKHVLTDAAGEEGARGAEGARSGGGAGVDQLRAREGEGHRGGVSPAVADSLQYLRSEAARASIASDPYWPKWHSPWWHVLALHEAGVTPPREAVVMLAEGASRHYLTLFPRAPEALPAGKSLDTDVMCFCALGSLLQVSYGIAMIPWADDFLRRYQLADGGWNCEPHDHVSSVVSTVPVLEYLLLRPELKPMLDRGMAYLLERKLFRSKRTGRVIDEAWAHADISALLRVRRAARSRARRAVGPDESASRGARAGAPGHPLLAVGRSGVRRTRRRDNLPAARCPRGGGASHVVPPPGRGPRRPGVDCRADAVAVAALRRHGSKRSMEPAVSGPNSRAT